MNPNDVAEIFNLYGRYAYAVDGDSRQAIADCCTADVVYENSAFGRFAGSAAIDGVYNGLTHSTERPRHLLINIVVDAVDADQARARAVFLLLTPRQGIGAAGQYVDLVTRDQTRGWLFAERNISFMWKADGFPHPPNWP